MTPNDTDDSAQKHREATTPVSADGGNERSPSADHGIAQVISGGGDGGVADLSLVAVLTGLTAIALVVPFTPWPLVWVLGVPFVLFYPGYVWTVTLFPEAAGRLDPSVVRPQGPSSLAARVALSLVGSTIVVAIVGALLSPFGAISLEPVVAGITAVTMVGLLFAVLRRQRVPMRRRGGVSGTDILLSPSLSGTRGQNALTVLGVVALVAVVGAAIVVPSAGGAYSETYLLTEDGDEFVSDNLPEQIAPGESAQFHVGIENHENGRTSYDVVTVVQILEGGAVTDWRVTDGFTATLDETEQVIEPQEFTIEGSGADRRVQVLVYEGDRPDDPSAETADHVLQFGVAVEN